MSERKVVNQFHVLMAAQLRELQHVATKSSEPLFIKCSTEMVIMVLCTFWWLKMIAKCTESKLVWYVILKAVLTMLPRLFLGSKFKKKLYSPL